MKPTGLLIAAVVLLALVGGLYWSNHHKVAEDLPKTDVSPKLFTLDLPDISKIEVKKKGGDDVVLAKNDAGKWELASPKPLPADQDAASGVASTLASLSADRLIEDKASNLDQYGLTSPALEVDVTTKKDGKVHQLLVGDDTPTGNASYVKLENDPRVFTLTSATKSNINKTPNDLRDKRLLLVDSNKISRVELIDQVAGKSQDIEFGRNKDEWQILKPKPMRADNLQVGELVRKVQDAKMDTSVSDDDAKKAASAFAAGTPVATIKVTDTSGTQELQVRKNKDDYYAKSTAVPGVYKVTAGLGSGLDKSVDDFRNKKLFDFGFNDPNKIEMHDGSKSYLFTKSGDDWTASGKKLDAMGIQSFIDKLRELSASKFVDTGYTTSTIDVNVTSDDGKRVEKVQIAKVGDKYIARRENEPSLYELDSKTVDDLEKAASDVKPAQPAKK